MNHIDPVWAALKSAKFPTATGEEEKRLKIAFLHGANSMRQLFLGATSLPDREMVDFYMDIKEQLHANLAVLGEVPGNARLNQVRAIAKVNGEEI